MTDFDILRERVLIKAYKKQGIKLLNELPEGWRYIDGGTYNYKMACNNKSRFKNPKEYEHALIKQEGKMSLEELEAIQINKKYLIEKHKARMNLK